MSETLKYVSAKPGHLMPRYGTQQNIGGRIVSPGKIVWHEKEVVALTEAEWTSYVKEYERAKTAGVIVERSKADYDAWLKLEVEREARELEERKKAEAAEAEEARKADAATKAEASAKLEAANAASEKAEAASVASSSDAKFSSSEPATADEVTKGAKRARGER